MFKKLIKHAIMFSLVFGVAFANPTVAGVILVFAVYQAVKDISELIDVIIAMPGKGFAKVTNYFKNRKVIGENAKLDKALMKADFEARLNAARQNPNYKGHPSVKKILAKREYKQAKKDLKK